MSGTKTAKTNKIRQEAARRAARIAEAVRLRREFGLSNKEIARRLDIGQRTVERYFSEALAHWQRAMPESVEIARYQVFHELKKIVQEAEAEYERSKQPKIETTMEREPTFDDDGKLLPMEKWKITKVSTRRIERTADERFLARRESACWKVATLFGLPKPVPQEVDVRGEFRTMTAFGLLQLAEEAAKPENLPTIISADGRVMVRGPDGVPRLPDDGNGEEVEGDGDGAA